MKKLISVALALFIMLSGSMSFAASQGKGNGWKAAESQRTESLEELLAQFEEYYQDMERWREFIREITDKKDKDKDTSLRVIVKGKEIKSKGGQVIKYNGVVLPVNPITKGMGATVKWDAKKHTITITKGSTTIVLNLDSKKVLVNGSAVTTDILNSRNGNKTGAILQFIARILGYDAEDYDDGLIIIDEKKVQTINDNTKGTGAGQFEYSANWTYGYQKNAYRSDNHWSDTTGESFQVRFDGTQIKLYGAKAPAHGIAAISIDGGQEVLVDYYAVNRRDNTLVYTSPVLSNGQHILKVRVTGTRNPASTKNTITADRVDIIRSNVTAPANDVALNKVSYSDSLQAQNTAPMGNDGKLDTRWCAADGNPNHWWMVDLGGLYNLSGSEVNWEFDGKLYQYKIETSADGSTWNTVINKTNNTNTRKVQVDNFNAITVRYVRITVTGTQTGAWASFWDFKVFGVPTSADNTVPTAPTELKATAVSQNRINLTWKASSDNTGIAGYKVFRNGQQVAVVTGSTAFSDTGLTSGTAYVYTVAAFDAVGNTSVQSSTAYAITKIVTDDRQAPTIPAGLTATEASSTQINLAWNASTDNTGVAGYKIYRNSVQIALVTVGNTYIDTGLLPGTAYVYTVAAYDAAGNTSAKSSTAYAITKTSSDTQAPSVPTWVTASAVLSTQVNLSWTTSTDNIAVAGYKVFRNDQQIATVTSGTAYNDIGLSASTIYLYTIAAYDTAGNTSEKSIVKAVATPASSDTQAPAAPAGLTATAAVPTQVSLSWTASTDNTGVTGYKVFRNDQQIATVTSGTTYTDTGLAASTTYVYSVAAFDAAGNTSEKKYAGVTTPAAADTQAPTVPVGLTLTAVSANQVNVSWTASTDNTGVAGYKVYRGGTLVATVTAGAAYADTGLSASTVYAYSVAAFDAAGNVSLPCASMNVLTQTA